MSSVYHRFNLVSDEQGKHDTIATTSKSWMPYRGRRCRKLDTLLPSNRAFVHVPLAGEVLEPERKERAPVSPADTNEHTADQRIRCEIGKTLIGEQCQMLGEVQLDGSLLCVHHAELLKLEEHSDILLGTVFEMDKRLDDIHNRTDELRWRRVLRQRDVVVEELRSTSTRIEGIRIERRAGRR
jgi:hypothetical protein